MNNRIAEILKNEGLTNSQFANLIGVQASAITHILNGRNEPSLKIVRSILDNFRGINPDWLVSGIGEMYRKSPEIIENKEVKAPKPMMHPVQQSLFPEYPIPTPEYGKENELTSTTDSGNNVADINANLANPSTTQTQQFQQPIASQNQPTIFQQPQPVAEQPYVAPIQNQPVNQPQANYNAPINQTPYHTPMVEKKEEKPVSNPVPPRVVKKIVVFYSDGTYEEYGAHLNIN